MNAIARRILSKLCHLFFTKSSLLLKTKGRVLMLHDIGKQESEFCITINNFSKLLSFLSYKNTVRLENWNENTDFYAISFDDIHENFYLYAFPLLIEAKIPFTIFVNVSLIDKPGYVSTEQLQDLVSCGLCTIGSHGCRHIEYYNLSEIDFRKELMSSKKFLEEIVGKPIRLFAFPYGSFYSCGYKYKSFLLDYYSYGFSTVEAPITDPNILPDYFLPRINVDTIFIKKL